MGDYSLMTLAELDYLIAEYRADVALRTEEDLWGQQLRKRLRELENAKFVLGLSGAYSHVLKVPWWSRLLGIA